MRRFFVRGSIFLALLSWFGYIGAQNKTFSTCSSLILGLGIGLEEVRGQLNAGEEVLGYKRPVSFTKAPLQGLAILLAKNGPILVQQNRDLGAQGLRIAQEQQIFFGAKGQFGMGEELDDLLCDWVHDELEVPKGAEHWQAFARTTPDPRAPDFSSIFNLPKQLPIERAIVNGLDHVVPLALLFWRQRRCGGGLVRQRVNPHRQRRQGPTVTPQDLGRCRPMAHPAHFQLGACNRLAL